MASSAVALDPLRTSAMRLLDAARTMHEKGDYRWLFGREMCAAILQHGIALNLQSEAEWKGYEHLVNALVFVEFCGLPGACRYDIQPTVGILLRDGIPYGAIHCEASK